MLWTSTIKRENLGQTRILFMVEVGVLYNLRLATAKQVFTDCDQVLSKF
ncbi:hypothetical protein D778_02665 [Xanthomarina gelatinilytica]|uniref:Uncharacterized protein n=1 Tax=Xanthomarina gelatinilytica TaxID=1137281 RepID=M7NA71_9FLAO|nr:hypothetical protein D778_02665 [Xanthomarina gelatinilytica]